MVVAPVHPMSPLFQDQSQLMAFPMGGSGYYPVQWADQSKESMDGAGFYPVQWADQSEAPAMQVWAVPAPSYPAPQAEVVWVPVTESELASLSSAQADVQGVPMMYPFVQNAASRDAGSSQNGWNDAESWHSAACGNSAASEQAQASRSQLRRERRKRAARLRTEPTGAADADERASPPRDAERGARAEHRADRAEAWLRATAAVTEQEAAFCAEATEGLLEGGEARERALAGLKGSVLSLSLTAPGTRLVQLALDSPAGAAAELVRELHGHVWEATCSPHANFALQAVIERLPATQALFIAREIQGQAPAYARHSYGCRILCRLFEQCLKASGPPGLATAAVAGELVAEAGRLSWHSFGHHAVETLLEHGSPEQRSQICAALRSSDGADGADGADGSTSGGSRLARSARNRSASHVVRKALTFGGQEDRAALVEELLGRPEQGIQHLAESHFGSHMAASLLQLSEQELPRGRAARELLRAAKAFVRRNAASFRTKHGRRLLEESGVLESL